MNRSSHYATSPVQGANVPFAGIFAPAEAIADVITQAGMGLIRAIETLHRGIAYRQTVRALNRLDQRTLNDIGIQRSEITDIARDLSSR